MPPSQPVRTEVIHGINIKKEKNNPTYATISPADLTSFNSIAKTYLNFKEITIFDVLAKFSYGCYLLFLISPQDRIPRQMYLLD